MSKTKRRTVEFQDEMSVRTKVTRDGTVVVTVMNHTTMETETRMFSFRDLFSVKEPKVQQPQIEVEEANDDSQVELPLQEGDQND